MPKRYLNQGDLVKYHIESAELNELGFVLGRLYEVKSNGDTSLKVLVELSDGFSFAQLIDIKGELTDYADNFLRKVD